MKKTKKRIISLLTAVIMIATMIPVIAVPVAAASTPYVYYRTHIQNIGWQDIKYDGATSGTSGKSLRLEAIQIAVNTGNYGGGIEYCAHVQNIGWQAWTGDGYSAGTSGKSLRLEAVCIQLYGEISKYYDVWYRVHSQQFGWLGWAKNGAEAGTASYSYRLEAIQILLKKKNTSAPGSTTNAFVSDYTSITKVGRNPGSIVSNLNSSYFSKQNVSGYSNYYKGKTLNGGITVAWGTGTNLTYIHSVNARLRLFTIVPGATKVAKATSIMTDKNYKRTSNSSSQSTWQSKSDSHARVTLTYKNGFVYGFDVYYKK